MLIIMLYLIAENFQGRKCSWISHFERHPRKFSPQNFGHAVPTYNWFSIPWKSSPWNVHFLSIHETSLPYGVLKIRSEIWYYCTVTLIWFCLSLWRDMTLGYTTSFTNSCPRLWPTLLFRKTWPWGLLPHPLIVIVVGND